jgi:cytochrome b561
MKKILVSRYHPLLVLLHWLLAVLIVAMLCIGFIVLEPMSNIDPQKIGILAALYHQFVRRDELLRRMWFGRRALDPPVAAR